MDGSATLNQVLNDREFRGLDQIKLGHDVVLRPAVLGTGTKMLVPWKNGF